MTWPLVKFVAAPEPAATVRFDCNDSGLDAPRRAVSFDPGVPTLEGDPDAVGRSWGFRSPTLVQRIKGSKQDALRALSALSREQLRRENWVLWQLSADTTPVWFHTYATGYQPLTLDRVGVDVESGDPVPGWEDAWEITVPLVADAFAYGQRVSLGPFTVVQDIGVANPMRVELPAIKGDAPTGLRVEIAVPGDWDPGIQPTAAKQLLVGVVGADTVGDTIVDIGTGDGFSAGTGTSADVADATAFGESRRRVTIADNEPLTTRLSGQISPMTPGRTKVFLRWRGTGVGGGLGTPQFQLRLWSPSGPALAGYVGPLVTPDRNSTAVTNNKPTWVELGEFTFPLGVTAAPDVTGVGGPFNFWLNITTQNQQDVIIDLDCLRFVRVDGDDVTTANLLYLNDPISAFPLRGGNTLVVDGDSELVWARESDTGELRPARTQTSGGMPTADPAAAVNTLLLMSLYNVGISTSDPSLTDKGATCEVLVSYHPRWLHIGDGS